MSNLRDIKSLFNLQPMLETIRFQSATQQFSYLIYWVRNNVALVNPALTSTQPLLSKRPSEIFANHLVMLVAHVAQTTVMLVTLLILQQLTRASSNLFYQI